MEDLVIPARGHAHRSTGRTKGQSKLKNGPVHVLRVNPRIWQTAIAIADGKPERIEVITPTNVFVYLPRNRRYA